MDDFDSNLKTKGVMVVAIDVTKVDPTKFSDWVSAISNSSRKSNLKNNTKPLSAYLKKYDATFSKSIDQMWEEHDIDKNGYLDKDEAKTFLDELAQVISENRKKFYDPNNFESIFEEYDEDGNNYLSKSEMSALIKMTFRNPSKI